MFATTTHALCALPKVFSPFWEIRGAENVLKGDILSPCSRYFSLSALLTDLHMNAEENTCSKVGKFLPEPIVGVMAGTVATLIQLPITLLSVAEGVIRATVAIFLALASDLLGICGMGEFFASHSYAQMISAKSGLDSSLITTALLPLALINGLSCGLLCKKT